MQIGVLTSSRADYGIYSQLLRELKADPFFEVTIIAFGTHQSPLHGSTIKNIYADGYYDRVIEVLAVPEGDSPLAISQAMGRTINEFARVWSENKFDLVLCLGDRYEMFAACASSIPFNVKLAHISGGEQTLGAIDDALRHCMTHMSAVHFATAELYKERVAQLISSEKNVYNVGALNIDTIVNTPLLSKEEFKDRFRIDLDLPTILITFHPETISFERNEFYAKELVAALSEIKDYQLVITMPNADTMGNVIRQHLQSFIAANDHAFGVESFGTLGYFSCMKHCSFMLGNTSSGFVEASYFNKYVINLGDRQKGRILTPNIRNCRIEMNEILKAIGEFRSFDSTEPVDVYGKGDASKKIIHIIKNTL